MAFPNVRSINRHDTLFLTRYVLAIAVEITVAIWLLSIAKGEFAWATWIAYLILASAALATLIGLSWCWFWLVGRGFGWFFAAMLSVVVALLLISGPTINWHAVVDLGRFVR